MLIFLQIVKLLRISHWVKNFFLFFPLIFSGHLFNVNSIRSILIAFLSFSVLSSAFYVLNDIFDRKKDLLHPGKADRPIASGKISVLFAYCIAFIFVFLAFAIGKILGETFLGILLIYGLLQVLYNRLAKRMVLWDVIFIAFGFLLRVWAGAESIGVNVSFWLLMCAFVLALFLGFAKRRSEMTLMRSKADAHRDVLKHYTVYFLDQVIMLCSVLSIVFYSLYTISPEVLARVGGYMMVPSVVFVIYGNFRYLYLIHVSKQGCDPSDVLMGDRPLLANILAWSLFCAAVIYFR